jgi:hypothetical protein
MPLLRLERSRRAGMARQVYGVPLDPPDCVSPRWTAAS